MSHRAPPFTTCFCFGVVFWMISFASCELRVLWVSNECVCVVCNMTDDWFYRRVFFIFPPLKLACEVVNSWKYELWWWCHWCWWWCSRKHKLRREEAARRKKKMSRIQFYFTFNMFILIVASEMRCFHSLAWVSGNVSEFPFSLCHPFACCWNVKIMKVTFE